MKIIDNAYDAVTISFEPADCFRMAEALRLAETASQVQDREDLGQLWSTTAALFEALGMIAALQRYMPGKYDQIMRFHEEFNLATVQAGVMRDLERRPERGQAA